MSASTPPDDNRRLRVVVLDHVARLSGAEIALLRLLPHLKDVDVHVVLAEDGPLADRLGQVGVSVQVLPLGEASRELRKDSVRLGQIPCRALWDSAAYVVRLARLLRRERPDVVHANSLKSGLYGGLAARLVAVPLVWHLHDRLDADYLPRVAVILVRGAIARLATSVVANSHATAGTLRGGPTPRVIPSALPAALPAAHVPEERERLVFGMVGRLTPWKGQHVFLEAFARAFPDGPHAAALIGAPLFDEEDYERELRTLVERLGIDDRVQFRGFREDVWRELATLDVLVHASTSPEPFGQVVQEGLAVGLPIIAADAGGPAEFVRNGENGLLARPNDVTALVEPLQRLAGDLDLRRRLGVAARASVAPFAPEVVAPQMRAAYREAALRVVGRREAGNRAQALGRNGAAGSRGRFTPVPTPAVARDLARRAAPGLMADRARRYERRYRERIGATALAEMIADDRRVEGGPFAGMLIPGPLAEVDAAAAKLIGSYEEEISDVFAGALSDGTGCFVDVGCADGYYAVGMAYASRSITTFAFDLSASARQVCRRTATANTIADRVRIGGRCDAAALRGLPLEAALVLVDIEGAELDFFGRDVVALLARSRVVVEVHEQAIPGAGATLADRFAYTHHNRIVRQTPRAPSRYPRLGGMSHDRAQLALSEHRSSDLYWLVLTPHSASAASPRSTALPA